MRNIQPYNVFPECESPMCSNQNFNLMPSQSTHREESMPSFNQPDIFLLSDWESEGEELSKPHSSNITSKEDPWNNLNKSSHQLNKDPPFLMQGSSAPSALMQPTNMNYSSPTHMPYTSLSSTQQGPKVAPHPNLTHIPTISPTSPHPQISLSKSNHSLSSPYNRQNEICQMKNAVTSNHNSSSKPYMTALQANQENGAYSSYLNPNMNSVNSLQTINLTSPLSSPSNEVNTFSRHHSLSLDVNSTSTPSTNSIEDQPSDSPLPQQVYHGFHTNMHQCNQPSHQIRYQHVDGLNTHPSSSPNYFKRHTSLPSLREESKDRKDLSNYSNQSETMDMNAADSMSDYVLAEYQNEKEYSSKTEPLEYDFMYRLNDGTDTDKKLDPGSDIGEKRRRRRESHNAVERRRRDNINDRIIELSQLIPDFMISPQHPSPIQSDSQGSTPTKIHSLANNRPNKGIVLQKSAEYIRFLQKLAKEQKDRSSFFESQLRSLGVNPSHLLHHRQNSHVNTFNMQKNSATTSLPHPIKDNFGSRPFVKTEQYPGHLNVYSI